ncbi:MAG: anhydro-N-acetylmuramic acid kinase [Chloroflexota bacterium]|nr:anhydro-N-acetylmuramic acid kinase [Chloroflexota bacterium]MDE2948333.1 anhydro-N-acetylmuramic acid kinase [Chloroflexota bacterium]
MIVIGLMSGTSADGVDVAICDIGGQPSDMTVNLVAGATFEYEPEIRQRILVCCDPKESSVDQIAALHVDLAHVFADRVLELIDRQSMSAEQIDLIGSHGQTVWHSVLPNGDVNASLQIVEAAVLAERTGITTISNFRARDIAAGGQGAPLTSYIDWLLLRRPTRWRAVQNIGGMGNVTFLPPLSDETSAPVAFDTGPGNALLDAAVAHFSAGALHYDRDGEYARRGRVNEEWLDELLQHPYYARDYPKTTGRETFGTAAALALVADARRRGLTAPEIIATLTALTATNIADAYRRFAPAPMDEVILGGGGRHNPVMVGMLRELLAPAKVMTHEDIGMDSDFKEALVFALLAYETWHGRPATLPALTGARKASLLGSITPGGNYADLLASRQSNPRR